jgi:two-component system, NtrC family, sensor kinase
MKNMYLRTKIMHSILFVILFLGLSITIFGFFVVKKYVYVSAQEKVIKDLDIVRASYDRQFKEFKLAFNMVSEGSDLGLLRDYLRLDYLYWVPADRADEEESLIARKVFSTGQDIGATRIIPEKQARNLVADIEAITLHKTPKARPTKRTVLKDLMSMEYAKPFIDDKGRVEKVLVGGKLLNRNSDFIDDIVNTVFENRLYKSKPVGTITVFQDDVRVATNVLDQEGKRAIGTRVSEEVYKQVIEEGKRWHSQAFVVTDWYFTAYEPIRNIDGEAIGILYVGVLEEPFIEIQKNLFIALLFIIFAACVLSVILSAFVSGSISLHLTKILKTANEISGGNFGIKIDSPTNIKELNDLTEAVNRMAVTLAHRQEHLDISNKKLEMLNRSYLDLIGFVSHELKGVLSSIILNTYLIKKGILGTVSDKQAKTLNSIARNLDYLSVTVKNFLNLSRIEKNEIEINKSELFLNEHVFKGAIEAFEQQLQEKNMTLVNKMPQGLRVHADSSLLQIVANNLISNAIKYGRAGGEIRITAQQEGGLVEVEVYNDGQPIHEVDIEKLFKKFSRVVYRGMESIKGSGIGLYITKEIIKLHGGTVKAIPREKGNSFIFQIENNN